MEKTVKKFVSWLIDTYLYDYVVQREDYNKVQALRWSADAYLKRVLEELQEAYDSFYDRSFKTLEEFGESVVAEYIESDRIDIKEFMWSYHFRVPHTQFCTLRDPTKLYRNAKEVVIQKLTEAFRKHMQANLFRDL